MKQIWDKPEMIVLMRKKSDEVILSDCKNSAGGQAGEYNGCLAKFRDAETSGERNCMILECRYPGGY